MTGPLSLRAYARHRKALGLSGSALSGIQRHIRNGAIPADLLTPDGKIRDPEAADRALADSVDRRRVPITGPTAPVANSAFGESTTGLGWEPPGLLLGAVDRVGVAGAAFVGVRIDLSPFLRGAAEELRAAGLEPTSERLRQVVKGFEYTALWSVVMCSLNAVFDEEAPATAPAKLWVNAGREAARAALEAAHGEP